MFIEDVMEEHTDEVICSICKHYLSVKPILINIQNGESICGRCESSSSNLAYNHYFERFASQFTFPCKYRAQGCNVREKFEDIDKHEKSCFFCILQCSCSWSGNLLLSKFHYETKHRDLIIKEGDTVTLKENFVRFLFIHQNLPFFINCKHLSNSFSLEIICLKVFNDCKAIFTCTLVDLNVDYRIENGGIIEVPCANVQPIFKLHCEISMEFVNSISKNIICPQCSITMTPPILKCLNGHLTCIECTQHAFLCHICSLGSDFECVTELECFAIVSTFSCRWNCGKKFNVHEIREHEWACANRLYECCHYFRCEWRGYLTELTAHEHTCFEEGRNTNECVLILNKDEVSFLDNELLYFEFHLLTYNYFFEITCFNEKENIFISVFIKDKYANGHFSFVAELIHVEDSSFSNNKIYKLEHGYGATYSVRIYENDLLPFGKHKPYKITVRLIRLNEEERMKKVDRLYECYKNYRRLL